MGSPTSIETLFPQSNRHGERLIGELITDIEIPHGRNEATDTAEHDTPDDVLPAGSTLSGIISLLPRVDDGVLAGLPFRLLCQNNFLLRTIWPTGWSEPESWPLPLPHTLPHYTDWPVAE